MSTIALPESLPITKPKPVSAADIRSALRLRFPASSHALMWEVAPSTGGGTRYADAVAVGLWASHGHMIQGIEVKVSRADFLHEMKQPEKSQPVFRHCHRWWLACPKGLVKPEELPPTWGMLELSTTGALQPKVKAPLLTPEPVNLRFFASLCRRRAGLDEEMTATVIENGIRDVAARLRSEFEGKQAERLGYRQQSILDAQEKLERIKASTGIDLSQYKAEDDLIQAITMYRKFTDKAGFHQGLCRLRSDLSRVITALDAAGVEANIEKPS